MVKGSDEFENGGVPLHCGARTVVWPICCSSACVCYLATLLLHDLIFTVFLDEAAGKMRHWNQTKRGTVYTFPQYIVAFFHRTSLQLNS